MGWVPSALYGVYVTRKGLGMRCLRSGHLQRRK